MDRKERKAPACVEAYISLRALRWRDRRALCSRA